MLCLLTLPRGPAVEPDADLAPVDLPPLDADLSSRSILPADGEDDGVVSIDHYRRAADRRAS